MTSRHAISETEFDEQKYFIVDEIGFCIYEACSGFRQDVDTFSKSLSLSLQTDAEGKVWIRGTCLARILKKLAVNETNGVFLSRIKSILKLLKSRGIYVTKRRLTNRVWKDIGSRQRWRCNICSSLLTATFQIDHIEPLFMGGSDSETNLQALCVACHADKSRQEQRFIAEKKM